MALDKKIVKDSGLSVSYFRILNIEVNYVYDISTITIEEYISEDYRNKAKKKAELLNTIAELEQQSNTTKDFNATYKIPKVIIPTINLSIFVLNFGFNLAFVKILAFFLLSSVLKSINLSSTIYPNTNPVYKAKLFTNSSPVKKYTATANTVRIKNNM